jgi:hypothetical protein
LDQAREHGIEVAVGAGMEHMQIHPEGAGRCSNRSVPSPMRSKASRMTTR